MRLVFNLIHRGTRPINQEQNGLPPVVRSVEISEESQKKALKNIIAGYNERFGTNYRIEEFDGYYQDVQKRIKDL